MAGLAADRNMLTAMPPSMYVWRSVDDRRITCDGTRRTSMRRPRIRGLPESAGRRPRGPCSTDVPPPFSANWLRSCRTPTSPHSERPSRTYTSSRVVVVELIPLATSFAGEPGLHVHVARVRAVKTARLFHRLEDARYLWRGSCRRNAFDEALPRSSIPARCAAEMCKGRRMPWGP